MNIRLDTDATAEKKKAVFESTLKLVREYGFHGTPMSQIAQEAGVAIGTIYHYFASKDELIIELFRYCSARKRREVFRDDERNLPYPERFSRTWMNLVRYYIRHPEILSFIEQFFSSPYQKIVYPEPSTCMQNELVDLFEDGIRGGYIRQLDHNITGAAFIGTASAAAKRHIHGRFTFDEQTLREMAGVIWDGVKR